MPLLVYESIIINTLSIDEQSHGVVLVQRPP